MYSLSKLPISSSPIELQKRYNIAGFYGVNVYGWIDGDFGGGRTARCIVNSLISNFLPIAVINIDGALQHSRTNNFFRNLNSLKETQDYIFDIFAINAINTISTFSDSSNNISDYHYRIGVWHWETSYLPYEQGLLGDYYNEIWVPSLFVANAIISTASFNRAVLVKVIPYGYETLPHHVTKTDREVAIGRYFDYLWTQGYNSTTQVDTIVNTQNITENSISKKVNTSTSLTNNQFSYCSDNTQDTTKIWSNHNKTTFLFVVVFDFNSDFNRKNIIGTIKAFKKAFHSPSSMPVSTRRTNLTDGNNGATASPQWTHVGLVLKSQNGHNQPGDFRHLQWVVNSGGGFGVYNRKSKGMDPSHGLGGSESNKRYGVEDDDNVRDVEAYTTRDTRIVLIDGSFSDDMLHVVKSSTHCYLSLHKSEGYGLNIMEAVLMGVPVVSSAYSGSQQFMNPLYGKYLPELYIPVDEVYVDRPFGPYTTDMRWAEPSTSAAVYAMQQVFLNYEYYSSMAFHMRDLAIELLSPKNTGHLMKQRLDDVFLCLCEKKYRQVDSTGGHVISLDSSGRLTGLGSNSVNRLRHNRDEQEQNYRHACENRSFLMTRRYLESHISNFDDTWKTKELSIHDYCADVFNDGLSIDLRL